MRYILNADDFGMSECVNEAIVFGFDNGLLSRTTAIVTKPAYASAVELSEAHGFKDKVGLHVNLSSGEPLTDDIKERPEFCDKKGVFNGKIFTERKSGLILPEKASRAVSAEIEAQMKIYEDSGFTLFHLDSHGHVHTFPSLLPLFLRKAEEHGFKSIRLSKNAGVPAFKKMLKSPLNARIARFNRKHGTECVRLCDFRGALAAEKDKNGITEIMLHPNIFDGDMQIGQGFRYPDLADFAAEHETII